jgi:membrane associated rhomboid family serine protease
MILPIRTETGVRRSPTANVALISLNVLLFLIFHDKLAGGSLHGFKEQFLFLHSHAPAITQFFTYQFMHHDAMHLLGNMLFLWVFGNSVNGKMGHGPYILFYLGGGVFAGWGHAALQDHASTLLGASGAVAAITTAYLALFPRSRVTVLIWFFIIHFVEVPAILLIIGKVIIWDNMVGPAAMGSGQVAHEAHLAGYLYGFVGALLMLLVRGLPRDQFDILAVWKRWHQRRSFASVMANPAAARRAQYGTVARPVEFDSKKRAEQEAKLDEIADLRAQISAALEKGDVAGGASRYEELLQKSNAQSMSERHQLDLARYYYSVGKFPEAASAFDQYVTCYSNSSEADNVRLLLGIIYARDLKDYEAADKHLSAMLNVLRDDKRKSQCLEWLRGVRAALDRPAPDLSSS